MLRTTTLSFRLVACLSLLCLTWAVRPVAGANVPKGVILVVIDDIGYGDVDHLHPSDLETPNIDVLCRQSVRLTDFHVGTTCAPTRASLMTGRSVNAGGVWHTIAGRELLRRDERTMAEVFQANGWRTGIFGKWHLGEGYPFSPRFRGFDVSVIHGGGGVGQGPDSWGNDYYSGVDFDGQPTAADAYWENGRPFKADQFCTDLWFARSKQFIRESLDAKQPFFCYVPTNAAHGPFNAPHGYKKGFDGLIENVDDNMGKLDQFLKELGVRDDVLLIFTTDNGTTGKRLGGLRGRKGSHYDGGHNVPCFWRWQNGGLAGSEATSRDVNHLSAGMDLLPTFIDMFSLKNDGGGQPLHGISLRNQLMDPNCAAVARTMVIDTQRRADLHRWQKACVLRDSVADGRVTRKWRLTRQNAEQPLELYDFLTDRDTDEDLATQHQAVVADLTQAYESWWTEISSAGTGFPPFVVEPSHESELTLYSHSWIGADSSPWHQRHVLNAGRGTRTHAIQFQQAGRYRIELRRWPREDGGAIDGKSGSGTGKVVKAKFAKITLEGVTKQRVRLNKGQTAAVFELDVPAGEATTLKTALLDAKKEVLCGAYYVYIRLAE